MFGLTPLRPEAEKERRCPVCGEEAGEGHGQVRRRIRDVRYEWVRVQRMRCRACGYTYRVYGEGLEPYRWRSRRVRQLGVMLYALGLSYRKVEMVLRSLEAEASDTTVLRDVRGAGERVREMHKALAGRVRVQRVGIDGTGVAMAGAETAGVVAVVDLDGGKVLRIELVDERDREAVRRLVREVILAFGPEEMVTDEEENYAQALEEVKLEGEVEGRPAPAHRLCAAHFRRNKGRRLTELAEEAMQEGRPLLVMEARALRALLKSPPEVLRRVGREFHRMYLRAPPPGKGERASWTYRMRLLGLELMEKGKKVTGVTNNRTEAAIGNGFKIRTKTMRGLKKVETCENLLYLLAWFAEHSRSPERVVIPV